MLWRLKASCDIPEALILSTCNRTEIYAVTENADPRRLLQYLNQVKKVPLDQRDEEHFYAYFNEKAMRHLLRVSAGLDSLVIGEKEILGQVKDAIALSREQGMMGRFLNILTNITIRTGKLARAKTEISKGGSSISWAAVEMAKKKMGGLDLKSVLVIGAGKMSHLAAGDFVRKGVKALYIMNRTRQKGVELANKFHGQAVSFQQLGQLLETVDVCICSAGAPHYLIEKEQVVDSMRRRSHDLLMIDISMPRNIHPGVEDVDGVDLIGLDELDNVVASNVRQRINAVYDVEKIITHKIGEFYKKFGVEGIKLRKSMITEVQS